MLRVSHHCLLMATTSSPSAVSPAPSPPPPPSTTVTGSPPQSFFSPPLGTPATSPPPQPNANPPGPTTPSVPSPPTQSPLSTPSSPPPSPPLASPPPPLSSADPPSNSTSPPPTPISASPPISPPPRATPSSPTPPAQSSPPPVPSTPPTLGSPPPPLAQPIQRSPPPPSPTPPKRPPSPPSTSSPENSPPSVSPNPPLSSTPPPPSPKPPETSPPPPTLSQPPSNSPPPPASEASPKRSPPPPASEASPKRSPPPPASEASPKRSPPSPTTAAPILKNAPLPPRVALPNPPASQPTPPLSNSTPKASFPSSVINLAPPPYSPFSPPSSVNDTIPSAPENSKSIGNGGIATGGMVAILVALSVVMISLIGFGVWCIRKQRKDVTGFNGGYAMPSPLGSSPRSGKFVDSIFTKTTARLMGSGSSSDFVYTPPDPGSLGNSRSWFTYEELLKATNGFSSQNLLGKGGFGCVYYGRLPDGREVAVKQLNNGGGQDEREFKAEVEIISRIHHRHLVSLVGYCITKKRRLLIYDYLPNNTLYFHLGGEGRPVLDWATRVKIAAGAARGIAYLHEDCHPRIIHRDVKSSNILLDKNFEAKVSDFGLAKLAFDSNTHITTRVMGTFGYVAPEYASSGKLTEKSDVFSYGVVLLELITGRKPVDPSQPVGDESLVEWARPLLSHALDSKEFDALVDPRLEKNYVESEMFQMIEAAAACVRHSATKRPWMGQVVRAFDNLTTADITNGLRFGESEVVNSAQQSAEIRLFQRMAFGSQNYSTKFFSQGSSSSQG